METNLINDSTNRRSGRHLRRALHLGAGGFMALAIGLSPFLLHSAPHAFAAESDASPDAHLDFSGSMKLECPNVLFYEPHLEYFAANGNMQAPVHFVVTYPDSSTKTFDLDGGNKFDDVVTLQEGDHVTGSITANGQTIAAIDTYVDCFDDPPPSDPPPTTEPPSDPPPTSGPPQGGDLPETGSSNALAMLAIGGGLAAAGAAIMATNRRRRAA